MTYDLREFPELMTPGAVAKALHVDPKTVTRWTNAGKLPCIKTPGGHRRIPKAVIEAILRGEPLPAAPANVEDDWINTAPGGA